MRFRQWDAHRCESPSGVAQTCFWELITQTTPFDEGAEWRLVRLFYPPVCNFALRALNGWFLPSPP